MDIVAHEFTHAVISDIVGRGYTYGLEGNTESEALNEAYADILGNLIENKTNDGRWTTGEDYRNCSSVPSCGRHMAEPERAKYSAIQDGDSIYNMAGVFEYAAYKMMNERLSTSGISSEKWARVFYNSAQRLTFGAQFDDAANAVLSSAMVQGFTPSQLEAVRSAFTEVEILSARGYVPPSDTPAPTLIATIHLETPPLNLAVSRDGRFAVVDSFKVAYSQETGHSLTVSLTQINTFTGETTTDVIFEGTRSTAYPFGVTASPDGRYVYVLNGDTTTIAVPASIMVFDTATRSVVGDPIPIGTTPVGRLLISPDGKRVYATTMNVSAATRDCLKAPSRCSTRRQTL